jgi:capsular polysaccharide biosynthesis protein
MLRPPAWYIESWYPERNDLCRWTSGRAAALTPAKAWIDVSEPVLVLAANDSARMANYYHFMSHVLTRAVWLQRCGWLQRRKLLMPAEMRPWMADALQLAGITREQLLLYSEDENLRLGDAWLLSAFDYPSAQLIREVREHAWRATGIEPNQIADAPERFLFVRRPARSSRLPFDLQTLLAIAVEEGFECIDPAELSVADQVRKFASANGVAGFTGAGLTNLMFCRDGVRSLELAHREALWPDFDGLALAVGLRHRHCLGWIDTSCIGGQILHDAPARFDLDMFARQLRWVRRGQ